jgi:uncharacterized protein
MIPAPCVYEGRVVHKRLTPKAHALSYRVFAWFLDVDAIDGLAERLRLFSRNRWNVMSFHDRDHGAGGGIPVGEHARATLAVAGLAHAGSRVFLLCYPRVLGYGFNPLSVYYGYDAAGRLAAVIYEVNNTFGERRSYVIAVGGPASGGIHVHGCAKQLYVSPFTEVDGGRYAFRLGEPGLGVVVGVSLRDRDGPVLKTHFRGQARPIGDATIAKLSVLLPLQSFKVMGAIHFEALRLWIKGVPLTARPRHPRYAVTNVPRPPEVEVVTDAPA